MRSIADYTDIHFIGCGGAGMAPMMMIFHNKGFKVSGSDLIENESVAKMKSMALPVFRGHSGSNLPDAEKTLVVHSSAIADDNPELAGARMRNLDCVKRGEALALLASSYKRTVSVSGSHGKTSVTAMISFILDKNGLGPGFMIGGKPGKGMEAFSAGNGDIFVTEADESDGSHVFLKSAIGVVTNVEDDHCWSVGGEEKLLDNFRNFARNSERLLYVKSPCTEELFAFHENGKAFDPAAYGFTALSTSKVLEWQGFQLINAATAVEVSVMLGLKRAAAEKALESFPGVRRRMTLHYDDPAKKITVMEDYAHHPTELENSLMSLRKRFPGRRLRIVFQPHRYARLARYIDQFAGQLSKVEEVFVTPVFAAWVNRESVSSEDLAARIGNNASFSGGDWDSLAEKIVSSMRNGDVIAVIGAGDIDSVIPILIEKLRQ